MAKIELCGVTKRFGKLTALKNVNLEIGEGEFIYVTGKVGSGKSSLIKTFYGELPVSEGDKAEVLGYDMAKLRRKHLPELRRKLGVIFQDFQIYGAMLSENVVMDDIDESKKSSIIFFIRIFVV